MQFLGRYIKGYTGGDYPHVAAPVHIISYVARIFGLAIQADTESLNKFIQADTRACAKDLTAGVKTL